MPYNKPEMNKNKLRREVPRVWAVCFFAPIRPAFPDSVGGSEDISHSAFVTAI